MGYLERASVSISNSTTVSGSLWLRSATSVLNDYTSLIYSENFDNGDPAYPSGYLVTPFGMTITPRTGRLAMGATRHLGPSWGTHSFSWEVYGGFAANIWNHLCFACRTTVSASQIARVNGQIRALTPGAGGYDGWSMLLSSAYFSIGRPGWSPYYNVLPFELANVQIWFGSFIDWTNNNNFNKIIKITGSVGTPQNYTLAHVFGTPHFEFVGKASDQSFYFNRGSAGSFSKVGTISDFTPAPSY